MSSVLRRLVRRATGESSAGLRPRRVARFESGGFDSAFHDVHVEHAARPSALASAGDLAAAGQRARTPIRAGDGPHSMLRVDAGELPAGDGASHRDVGAEALHRDVFAEAPLRSAPLESAPLETRPGPLLPASSSPPSLEPSTPLVSTVKRRRAAPPAETRSAATVPTAVPAVRTAPEPLLPADVSGFAESAQHAAPPSAARAAAHTSSDETAAPEITIHIGRLDIRAEPPRPAPGSRAAKTRTLPPLSEYLRGRRS